MKRSTVGALLLLLLGAAGVLAWFLAQPYLFERRQRTTSDAADIDVTVRIGGDNYLGYWFITSPEMRKQAARRGLSVQFEDDGGAYADRLARFDRGEYDAIVLPVNSYLQHGADVQFPGVIVASISESRGADGIVGFADKIPTGKIEDLNDAGLEIVYTPASPSEFLLDLTIADFDLDRLAGSDDWRVPADGSTDVLRRARDRAGDVFVLWEPDLSRALALPEMRYVWGSDRFSGYIVDVFVFHRDFVRDHRTALAEFFKTYFRVLRLYANNRDRMIEEMRQATGLEREAITKMLEKIDWHDLRENRTRQFGIRGDAGENVAEGLVNSVISCTDVMLRAGRLDRDPLDANPYLITHSKLIEDLSADGGLDVVGAGTGGEITFEPLDDAGWKRLREVGTFRVEPITFQSWDNRLTDEGREAVDKIAQLLANHYPDYRIAVRGHTAPGGDERENRRLSTERAQAVVQYLAAVHGVDPDRMRAEGLGSGRPPQRRPGESLRAYRYRLSRVESVAFEANPL